MKHVAIKVQITVNIFDTYIIREHTCKYAIQNDKGTPNVTQSTSVSSESRNQVFPE